MNKKLAHGVFNQSVGVALRGLKGQNYNSNLVVEMAEKINKEYFKTKRGK